MSKKLEEMTGPELVAEWNRRNPSKPVKKFKDRATALKRLNGASHQQSAKASPKKGDALLDAFAFRPGGDREKLLQKLFKQQLSVSEMKGLSVCLSGIRWRLRTRKLPFVMKQEKNAKKEVTYGIYPR